MRAGVVWLLTGLWLVTFSAASAIDDQFEVISGRLPPMDLSNLSEEVLLYRALPTLVLLLPVCLLPVDLSASNRWFRRSVRVTVLGLGVAWVDLMVLALGITHAFRVLERWPVW